VPKLRPALAVGRNGDLYLVKSADDEVRRLGAFRKSEPARGRPSTGILGQQRIRGTPICKPI
jgi:hypothetical protein